MADSILLSPTSPEYGDSKAYSKLGSPSCIHSIAKPRSQSGNSSRCVLVSQLHARWACFCGKSVLFTWCHNCFAEAPYIMKSAVAVAQHSALDATTPQLQDGLADLMIGIATPRGSTIADEGMSDTTESSVASGKQKEKLVQGPPETAAELQSALADISRLQVDVAGMEAIISVVKGKNCCKVRGRSGSIVDSHSDSDFQGTMTSVV